MSLSIELDVPCRTRGGVELLANIYRPSGEGPWPTLVTRLPYSKEDPTPAGWIDPVLAARRGFMVVVQDCRGRFASGGDWQPYAHEEADGYDTVEWAAQLPGSNGRVGVYGPSYLGYTTWAAALAQPPSLAAIAPALAWCDPRDGGWSRGGALELGKVVWWSLYTAFDVLMRRAAEQPEALLQLQSAMQDFDALSRDGYRELPVHNLSAAARYGVPEMCDLDDFDSDQVAEASTLAGKHHRIGVPAFVTAGWYDIFLQGQIDNYVALRAQGNDVQLLVGPWTHLEFADPVGEAAFGIAGARLGPIHPSGNHSNWQLSWFGERLQEGGSAAPSDTPVRVFLMGRNEWRDEAEWPPPTTTQPWYLQPDGGLSVAGPQQDGDSTDYAYDPANPVPTLGGNALMAAPYRAGPVDQRGIESRLDVCVFTSEELQADLEVAGRVTAVLAVQSSAPSTDWVVRLCDVCPDGRSVNICDGIVRQTDGADHATDIEVDLWSTNVVFLQGHRLRVHVTSSSFPRWDRNLNTGDQRDATYITANQKVFHSAEKASRILLPVR